MTFRVKGVRVQSRALGWWGAPVLTFALLLVAGAPAAAGADKFSWAGPYSLDHAGPPSLSSVACPLASQCTAVDKSGNEVTFDPTSGEINAAGVKTVDGGGYLDSVTCPSPSQCTAVGFSGNQVKGGRSEVTFDPTSGAVNAAGVKVVANSGGGLNSVSCPSASQCTAVDNGGNEVTFDPTSGTVSPAGVNLIDNGGRILNSVACPSRSQCTAIDGYGNEVTFDPTSGTANAAGVKPVDLSGQDLWSVACPSTSQCTTVDRSGNEVTFDPTSGTTNAGVKAVDSGEWLRSVACPSASQCTAVDNGGNEVTFDPTSPSGSMPVRIPGANSLFGVSCSSASQCVAVDANGTGFTGSAGGGSGGTPTIKLAGAPRSTGRGVRVKLRCSAPAGQDCQTTDTLTSTETIRGNKPVAVAATHESNKRKLTIVVGRKHVSIPAGGTKTITVKLNARGSNLLRIFHELPVTLMVKLSKGGKTIVSVKRTLMIKPKQ